MSIKGTVHKYGDNVDTDVIYPARYNILTDPKELAAHCLEDLDRDFVKKAKPGDLIVAGENFGCGSCREHALIALKTFGVSCVIAKSFARIFYRSSINIGLPIIECPKAAEEISSLDRAEVDFSSGTIRDLTTGKTYQSEPFPKFIQEIIDANGLINLTKKKGEL